MKISETSTLKRRPIIGVWIRNISVSSNFLEKLINEFSMKQQWNINVWKISTEKFYGSITFASKSTLSINISSTSHKRSSNETSNFQRLAQKKHKWSILFASQSSLFHQSSLKKASTKYHWRSNGVSTFRRLAQENLDISAQYYLERSRQCYMHFASTKHQSSSRESTMLRNTAQINVVS